MKHDISKDVIYDTHDNLDLRRRLLAELEEQYPEIRWCGGEKPLAYNNAKYRYIYILESWIYHSRSVTRFYNNLEVINLNKTIRERIKELKI